MSTAIKNFGLPLNQEIAFSDHKNIYKRNLEKQQTKLLKKILPVKTFFEDREKILLVTPACSPITALEKLLAGYWIFCIKRCLLVFTDRRILHMPTKSNYSYKNSLAQIMHGDLQEITLKGKSLVCKYKNGEKEMFHSLDINLKKLKAFLDSMSLGGPMSKTKRRSHLCPRCRAELENNKYTCPSCRLIFKNKKEAKRISWVYPGGGYFFTRRPLLGILDAIAETFLIIMVAFAFIRLWANEEGMEIALMIFCVALAYEKLITVYETGRFIKEYIPVEKEFKVRVES